MHKVNLWRVFFVCLAGVVLLAGGTGLGLAGVSSVDGWARVRNLSANPGRSQAVQLARDPAQDTLHAVWMDSASGNEEILTRHRETGVLNWTLVENLSSFAWQDGGPALLFDRAGTGHLLWTRRYAVSQGAPDQGTDLMYRQWSDGAWQQAMVLDHNVGYLPGAYGLVLAEKSDRVVLFVVWSGGYRYAEFAGGEWSPLTAWDYSLGVDLYRVIVDGQDHLHAGAFGLNSSLVGYDYLFDDAYYLYNDGSGWTAPLNVSSTRGVAFDLDLAFDAQGRVHLVWVDPDNPYSTESLKAAVWDTVLDQGAWSPNVEITPYREGQTILDADLIGEPSGMMHLAWSEGVLVGGAAVSIDIYYQTGDGMAWFGEQKVLTTTQASRNLSLLTNIGTPYLAWEEGDAGSADRDIWFTHQVPPSNIRSVFYLPLIGKGGP